MIAIATAAGCLACALWQAVTVLESGDVAAPQEELHFSFEPADDLDYDDLPDDWVRRKGPKFPKYVKIGIDGSSGCAGEQSLRIDANGGAAVLYSPLKRIDELHTYRFRGKIRTKNLAQDAACVSVSLLNHRRQRIQRFLTPAVTGHHDEWVEVEVPPITPDADTRFVVIGCHLLPGEEPGITGSAWFDDLVLTRSPRLAIDGHFFSHFKNEDAKIKVVATVSGVDAGHEYAIRLEFFDADGHPLHEQLDSLPADPPPEESMEGTHLEARTIEWNLDRQSPGYYRVSATLYRDGRAHLREDTSIAVMRLVDRRRIRGEFGWSFPAPPKQIDPGDLAEIAGQAGISWIKYPVWNSVRPLQAGQPDVTGELAAFFQLLENKHIHVIGTLSDPPPELRAKFSRNWLGVSEIFSTQSQVWGPTLEPVVARFSSSIRHWQLGGEADTSFEGLSEFDATLRRTRQEINRMGLNAEIGLPWSLSLKKPLPDVSARTLGFVSLREMEAMPIEEMLQAWKAANCRGARWAVLQPHFLQGDSKERAVQLVRQIIAAKVAGIESIFVDHIVDGKHGLLNVDGSPADLFLPWRTTALALQDSEYVGEITFPLGSRNAVFHRLNEDNKPEIIVFIWSDRPLDEPEQFYLGENVVEVDLWGRAKPVRVTANKEQIIEVGTIPKILRGCSEPIARWRLATQFAVGKMRSEYGTHEDAVLGHNTFPLGISGKVSLETPAREQSSRGSDETAAMPGNNSGWQADPREWMLTAAAREAFRLPVFLTLPTDANIGDAQMKLTFTITADRAYRFQVLCPLQVGSGDVRLIVMDRKLDDGRLEIEQLVVNSTSPAEVLDFRCNLMVPGSRRQKVQITKLGVGEDRKFYYLNNADSYRDKELRLKLEQDGGGRVLNHKWTVGEFWDLQTDESQSKRRDDKLQPPESPPDAGVRERTTDRSPRDPVR